MSETWPLESRRPQLEGRERVSREEGSAPSLQKKDTSLGPDRPRRRQTSPRLESPPTRLPFQQAQQALLHHYLFACSISYARPLRSQLVIALKIFSPKRDQTR